LLFADNFWLFGCSPKELSEMTSFWLRLLQRAGWQAPVDEMTWCTTGPDETNWQVQAAGLVVSRASRKVGFKALGVQVTFDNQYSVELEARIKSTWRSFYKFFDLLGCRSAPIGKRLKLMTVALHSALFWCAGSWNLTTVQLSKLRGIQQRMIRKMVGSRRSNDESLADYMVRSARTVKHLMLRHRVESWDAHYHRLQFKWGGEVARMVHKCPAAITYQVLKHKDIRWIHTTAEQYGGNQQHCRKLHTWRWERCFIKYSPSWQEDALDKTKWTNSLDDMGAWRCNNR